MVTKQPLDSYFNCGRGTTDLVGEAIPPVWSPSPCGRTSRSSDAPRPDRFCLRPPDPGESLSASSDILLQKRVDDSLERTQGLPFIALQHLLHIILVVTYVLSCYESLRLDVGLLASTKVLWAGYYLIGSLLHLGKFLNGLETSYF